VVLVNIYNALRNNRAELIYCLIKQFLIYECKVHFGHIKAHYNGRLTHFNMNGLSIEQ